MPGVTRCVGALPMLPRFSRRSAGGSSARCADWATWKQTGRPLWPPGMSRCATPNQNSPVHRWPRSSSALAGSAGAVATLYRTKRHGAGTIDRGHQWKLGVPVSSAVVRRHHWHHPLTGGVLGKTGGARPFAARPPGSLRRLSDTAQQAARGDPSHPAPTGDRR
jgi:hypothetical protein